MKRMMSLSELKQVIAENQLVLLVMKSADCGVCESVQAKLSVMLESRTGIAGIYVYIADAPDVASEYLALSAPTVLVFHAGKEVYRITRFVLFDELDRLLSQYEQLSEEHDG